MKIAVRYYTRSGNTKKLAEAIAKAVSVDAKDVSVALDERVDILFLGCSYYAFDVDQAVKDFILNNKDAIGKIVCFGTSAMMKSMKKPVTKVAKTINVVVSDEDFHCRGQFGKIHKGRPNEDDLMKAAEFAKRYV
ncbi:MAG: flavodoxin [Ruminococcaceae bacterium]|nr:flavodoxin [Oscillospiraceae bacterium]